MKLSIFPILFGLLCCSTLYGQIKIGDNPQNIDPSSVLELESSERVLVITRVTTAEMDAILPLQGALVYNTDLQCVHYYDGTQWVNLCENSGAANITADPIVHDIPTIALTPSADGTNIEIAENSIRSEMIVDGGVNGVDIQNGSIGPGKLQNQSVTQDKLSENAVGAFALDNANIDLSDFTNNVGYITNADIVSTAPDNAITNDGFGAFFDQSDLDNRIETNTNALNALVDPNLQQVLAQGNAANNALIRGLGDPTAPQDATNKRYVDGEIAAAVAAGGTNPNDELITNLILNGSNQLVITEGINPPIQVDLSSLAGGSENTTDELITDTELVGNILRITEGGNVIDTDLSGLGGGTGSTEVVDGSSLIGLGIIGDPFRINPGGPSQILATNVGGNGVDWVDLPPSITLPTDDTNGQILSSLGAGSYDWIDPPTGSGNPAALDVTFTPAGNTISTDVQGAIEELQTEIDGISTGGAANPTDELITSFALNGTGLEIAEGANILPAVDLDAVFATDIELATAVAADGDSSATNEIQDLALATNTLTITNNPTATPIDLAPYLDNTDAQDATLVPVTATPANYTATTPDVQAHLAGIDAALLANGGNPTDEIQDLALATNILTITNNVAATPIDLTPYLDNTDTQSADLVPVASIPVNYTAATPDVEAHLEGIDAALLAGGGNPTDEIQDLALATNTLTITNNATATPIDLSPYLDNTDTQSADLVPVAATPANYTAATPDVEAHLEGIDVALATGGAINNLATDNQTQDAGEDRTYDLNGRDLVFTGTGSIGIGNGANPPQNKFHVAGEIRSEGINLADGTANNPALTFAGDTNNDTGLYRPAADEIGFTVGGFVAMLIDEPSTGNTKVVINQNLELEGELTDFNNSSGTAGQILSSTGAGVDWIDTPVGGGADGVVSNIAISGTELAVTGANGGFNGNVDLEPLVDAAAGNNGYLTVEADADPNNEIQILSILGSDLTLSNGGGTVNIPGGANDGVISNIAVAGTDLAVTGANGGFNGNVDLEPLVDAAAGNNGYLTVEGDADPNNEIQALSILGSDLTLSNGGGTVTIPGGANDGVVSNIAVAGTDLAITGANGGFNGNVDLEPLVDAAAGNNGYLTTEIDGSVVNETITGFSFDDGTNILTINEAGNNWAVDFTGTTVSAKLASNTKTIRRVSTPKVAITSNDHTLIVEGTVGQLNLPSASQNLGQLLIIKDLGGLPTALNMPYRDLGNNPKYSTINGGVIWLQSDGIEWQLIK